MSYIACMLLLNLDVRAAFQCFANLVNASVQYAFVSLESARMDSHVATYDCPSFARDLLTRMLQATRFTNNMRACAITNKASCGAYSRVSTRTSQPKALATRCISWTGC